MRRVGLAPLTLGILALWFVLPILQATVPAQDAIAVLVAGSFVGDAVDVVYEGGQDLYDLPPAVRERTCEFYDDVERCVAEGVAFISPPVALPVVAIVAAVPDDAGVLFFRVTGVLAMAAGFVALVRRTGAPPEEISYALAAIALLPAVSRLTELGQTSGVLFLLACLPVHRMVRRGDEAVVAALLVIAIAMKGFPVVLLVPLVLARRWRLTAMVLGGLAALAVVATVTSGVGIWSGFVDQSQHVADASRENPYNLAVPSVLDALGLPAPNALGIVAALALTAVVVASVRRAGFEVWWVVALPLSFLFLPQVWNHYLPVVVPLVVVCSLGIVRAPDRWLAGAAVATLPFALSTSPGWSQRSGLVLVLAGLGTAILLVRQGRDPVAARATAPAAVEP